MYGQKEKENREHYIEWSCICRFDLIFLILDPQDELYDRRLSKHLVSLYYHQSDEERKGDELVSPVILKVYSLKYIYKLEITAG